MIVAALAAWIAISGITHATLDLWWPQSLTSKYWTAARIAAPWCWPALVAATVFLGPWAAARWIRRIAIRKRIAQADDDDLAALLVEALHIGAISDQTAKGLLVDKAISLIGAHRLAHYGDTEPTPNRPSWPAQLPAPKQMLSPTEIPHSGTIRL